MHFSDEITRLGCPADVTGPDGLVQPLLCARRRKPMDRRLETAGEIEMAMPMKRVLCLVVASCALIGALYLPARGAGLNIETATIADLNAAFAEGTLTSEQLVSAYLKRIEAYDKQGPAINAVITLNKKALDEARQLDAERKSGKVRGPLHGIPIVLKDNYDTVDMQRRRDRSFSKAIWRSRTPSW
jgi:hypothetical protein